MREKWGKKFNMVRAGNEKADQLAHEATKKETPQLYSRLVDKETEIGVPQGPMGKFKHSQTPHSNQKQLLCKRSERKDL